MSQTQDPETMEAAEQAMDNVNQHATTTQDFGVIDELDIVMRARYGLRPADLNTMATQEAINDAIKMFKPHYTTQSVSDMYHDAIYQFVQDIQSRQMPASSYCDWSLNLQQLRALYPNRHVNIVAIKDGWIVDAREGSTVSNWVIYIEDPLTIMEIVRRNWTSSNKDIARQLLQHGMPWRMLHITTTRPQIERPPRQSVSVLPVTVTLNGSEPNVQYSVYDRLRRQFFSQPRSKVALQYGGILWRIGIELLDIEQVIAAGPSNDLRHALVVELPDGHWGVGDGLSEEEIELVLGMYRTYNRK